MFPLVGRLHIHIYNGTREAQHSLLIAQLQGMTSEQQFYFKLDSILRLAILVGYRKENELGFVFPVFPFCVVIIAQYKAKYPAQENFDLSRYLLPQRYIQVFAAKQIQRKVTWVLYAWIPRLSVTHSNRPYMASGKNQAIGDTLHNEIVPTNYNVAIGMNLADTLLRSCKFEQRACGNSMQYFAASQ
jgi:hypothetical protein